MKKISFALVILFSLLGGFLHVGESQAFIDLSPDDPNRHMLEHLRDVGIMSVGKDTFDPSSLVTRAEALTIALRAGGIHIPAGDGGFTFEDVDPNAWYAPTIARALELNIIGGNRTHFHPNAGVSKAEFLAFLFRATKVEFWPFQAYLKDVALDVSHEDWFAGIFAYAKQYQIAHLPADNMYRPEKLLTRREVGVMTYRQLKIFYGDDLTKTFAQMQAYMDRYMTLMRAGESDEAQRYIYLISELTDRIMLLKNNEDAIAAQALSRALFRFTEGLRAVDRSGTHKLRALENLHLASKHIEHVEKSESLAPVAHELKQVIQETLYKIAL